MPELAGREIGSADRYTIEAPISRGAMGAVYRARDAPAATVAIKQLLDPSQSARFEIEARLLARLQPSARRARASTTSRTRTGSYLVMELVEGDRPRSVLREQRRARACR